VKLITSKQELVESLKDVRAVEIMARKGYEEDILTFRNFEITNTVTKIKIDEDTHIALLDELIKMLDV
jgi:hypothetical protein